MSRMPAATASWTTYWITGRSTMVIISLGIALEAGRQRVPKPATGSTALRIMMKSLSISQRQWMAPRVAAPLPGEVARTGGMGMPPRERVSWA